MKFKVYNIFDKKIENVESIEFRNNEPFSIVTDSNRILYQGKFKLLERLIHINDLEVYDGDIINTIDGDFIVTRWGDDAGIVLKNDQGIYPYYHNKYDIQVINNILMSI